jgi:hypothetical protein
MAASPKNGSVEKTSAGNGGAKRLLEERPHSLPPRAVPAWQMSSPRLVVRASHWQKSLSQLRQQPWTEAYTAPVSSSTR